ncbi:MAG: hypothetical protein ACE14L_03080 [Terriglobales bacterium]
MRNTKGADTVLLMTHALALGTTPKRETAMNFSGMPQTTYDQKKSG